MFANNGVVGENLGGGAGKWELEWSPERSPKKP